MTNTKYIIRVVVVGAVSTGKSTLINSIFTNKYSDTKIKRTTMIPQVYLETTGLSTVLLDSSIINSRNTTINENILNNIVPLTKENCVEITHLVSQIKDIINLHDNVFLEIYDLPGLDDSQQEAVYFDYLKDNFEKFDLVIFNIDINEALNTSGSTRILNEIITNIENSKHKKYLLVVVNKCDNMNIDIYDELELDDKEQHEMYEQITNTLQSKINFTSDKLEMKITKISALDSYIYRMLYKNPEVELDAKDLDKFGINELGKTKWKKMTCEEKKLFIKDTINDNYIDNLNTCGFNNFKNNLNTLLSNKNQYDIHYDRLMTEIKNLNMEDIDIDVGIFNDEFIIYDTITETINIINTFYKRYIKLTNIYKITEKTDGIINNELFKKLEYLIVKCYLRLQFNLKEISEKSPFIFQYIIEEYVLDKGFKDIYEIFANNINNDLFNITLKSVLVIQHDNLIITTDELCRLLNEEIINKLVKDDNINNLYTNNYYFGQFHSIKEYIKHFYTNIKYFNIKKNNIINRYYRNINKDKIIEEEKKLDENLKHLRIGEEEKLIEEEEKLIEKEEKLIQIIFNNILRYTPKILKNTYNIDDNLPVYSLVKYIKTFTNKGNDIIKNFYQKWLCKKYIDFECKEEKVDIKLMHSDIKDLILNNNTMDDLLILDSIVNAILYYTNIIHYQECSNLYEKYKDNEFMSIYMLNNEINKNQSHYLYNSYPKYEEENLKQRWPETNEIFDLRYRDFIKNKSYLIEEVEYYFENF